MPNDFGPGSIAFTGFSANGNDNLAFVTLQDLPAGTVIYFTDNEWSGTAFNSGESTWKWTATGNVAAGTIITMDDLQTTATSNTGSITFTTAGTKNIEPQNEIVYAYVGAPGAPTAFLAAITNANFRSLNSTLTNTGLVIGQTAMSIVGVDSGADVFAYAGPRVGPSNLADFLPLINNPANWATQDDATNTATDGIAPDVPFSPAAFIVDPAVQVVSFAPGSLQISHAEGNGGTTKFTFTVQRSGGTTGTVNFSGSVLSAIANAADFGGVMPVFSGTIADGATSTTVTITVAGDLLPENDEQFDLHLQSVSNASAPAAIGTDNVASGTIVDDDHNLTIGFVGFNSIGRDNNLAFVALAPIAAGTTIHFTDNKWNGSTLATNESTWSWTATSDIAAGTAITLDNLNKVPTSNLGTISYSGTANPDIGEGVNDGFEIVYAYTGPLGTPGQFIAAISNTQFDYDGATLAGTGLVQGVNAISLGNYNTGITDIAAYAGPHAGLASFADYLALINNPANWQAQQYALLQVDGIAPDAPFAPVGFSVDPATQIIEFAAGSLAVSHDEGNAGTTTFTFTVTRSGGDTSQAVNFAGGITSVVANGADFGGGLSNFTGSIPVGASSAQITITVKGDVLPEGDEKFSVRLQSISSDAPVALGTNIVATGTIVDDDAAPQIGFVGFNADGPENLAFVALGDIVAGTEISFTDKQWNGTSFYIGESAFTWTASSDIAAGTVVTLDGLGAGRTATSNHGTIVFTDQTARDIEGGFETVFAFQGSVASPTRFLAAIGNGGFGPGSSSGTSLDNTGLSLGNGAVSISQASVAAYVGPRALGTTFADFRALISNAANWVGQEYGLGGDGIPPDMPFSGTPFVVNPPVQTVGFSLDSVRIEKAEGNDGLTAFTFTVQRIGGDATMGDLTFSGTISLGTANAADFGGMVLSAFTGTIPAGASSAQITVAVSGDAVREASETFSLTLTSVSNPSAAAVLGETLTATATIQNDDAVTIASGQTVFGQVVLSHADRLVIEQGGGLQGVSGVVPILFTSPLTGALVDNAGTIAATDVAFDGSFAVGQAREFTITNRVTGVIASDTLMRLSNGGNGGDGNTTLFTINNYGQMTANGRGIDVNNYSGPSALNNYSTGVIESGVSSETVRGSVIVNNWGIIRQRASGATNSQAAIDFEGKTGGTVTNHSGGLIEGSKHAVTGSKATIVINEAGATMIGHNGSAVNMDTAAGVENTTFVTNRGTMIGASLNTTDSDGDAIDVDGLAAIENYGSILGVGASGYHSGEPNISEGIAIGGGTVNNYAGAVIYGYGRGIQVDNSGNAAAFSATTIYNEGLIEGGGNAPSLVDPSDAILYSPATKEGINIVGNWDDTVTNKGRIIGAVRMGGGNDTMTNSGMSVATGGSAVDMGDGNDSFTNSGIVSGNVLLGAGNDSVSLVAGSTISGTLDGGSGFDTLYLQGSGEGGALGAIAGIEKIDVQGGSWAIGGTAAAIVVGSGASLVVNGAAAGMMIAAGGVADIYGSVTGATVSGEQRIADGATAAGTTIDAGGEQTVDGGGTASHTTIAGGSQAVWGSADDTTIGNGGLQYVHGGVTDTTVDAGGQQNVYADGTATGTTVKTGAVQLDWGNAVDTTIDGGTQFVWGTATGTSIVSGIQHIADGATATGTTIGSGGTEYVHSGGSAHDVTFAGPNAALVLDDYTDFTGTISGWQFGDAIDLGNIAFDAAGTSFGYAENADHSGGTLTVTDGVNTASLALLGQYTASDFALSSDGHGGTLLTDPTVAQGQMVLAPAYA